MEKDGCWQDEASSIFIQPASKLKSREDEEEEEGMIRWLKCQQAINSCREGKKLYRK